MSNKPIKYHVYWVYDLILIFNVFGPTVRWLKYVYQCYTSAGPIVTSS